MIHVLIINHFTFRFSISDWRGAKNIPLHFRIPPEKRIYKSWSLFRTILEWSHRCSSLRSLEHSFKRKPANHWVLNTKLHTLDSTKSHPSKMIRSWYSVTYKEGRGIHRTSVYHFCRLNSSDWNSERHGHQAGCNWSSARGCQRPQPAWWVRGTQ